MPYLNTETNEYPRFEGDLILLGWKTNEPLPENWVEVQQDSVPDISMNQTYEIQKPKKINGIWRTTYVVRDMTEQEIFEREENFKKENEAI